MICARCFCTTSARFLRIHQMKSPPVAKAELQLVERMKSVEISRAMKMYLMKAKEHNTAMESEVAEYEIGKRYLANIMGMDEANFSQDDINHAIEYLLPSGLENEAARPFLKHPVDVMPRRKTAEMDLDGRPFNPMFYTLQPQLYHQIHVASASKAQLDIDFDAAPDSAKADSNVISRYGSDWWTQQELSEKFGETIKDEQYLNWKMALERLFNHPFASKAADFIASCRSAHSIDSSHLNTPEVQKCPDGRLFADAEGNRKSARAQVRVFADGKGRIRINGRPMLEYFPRLIDRMQLMFPLQVCSMIGAVDVEAEVVYGGPNSQAGAVRLALARALQPFAAQADVDKMRIAGLLTEDLRLKERKRPGQKGARAKFTWKKR